MKERFSPCVSAAVVALGVFLGAQEKGPAPVFRSGVDVVELDVSVLDRNRKPVLGLTAADFAILEDGVPQRISVFEPVVVAERPARPSWAARFGPDVSTNKLEDTRLFVIVFDDACLPGDQQVMAAAKQAVHDIVLKLGPADLAALIFTASSKGSQDFTADKARLLAALDRVNHGLACVPEVASKAVETLGRVADTLSGVPHRRKAMFWVSGGVPLDFYYMPVLAPKPTGAPRGGSAGTDDVDQKMSRLVEARRVADIAKDMLASLQRANVTVYGIDPSGLAHDRNTVAQDFLVSTSRSTGGRVVTNLNDLAPGIGQIFEENGAYYILGFTSTNRQAGSLRHVAVTVNRSDLEVHTRSEYFAAAESRGRDQTSALAKAIADVLPIPDLPMDVAIAPFAEAGTTKAAVTIAYGVTQPIPTRPGNTRTTESTDLLVSAFSPDGEPRGTQRYTAKVVIRAGATGVAQWEALGRIALPAGRYRLRLAAYSGSAGKAGSVYADIDVPDFTRLPFSVSGLVLNAAPTRPFAPKDMFSDLLPLVPTAAREFLPTDRVTAFLRVYEAMNLGGAVPLRIRVLDDKDQVCVDQSQVIGIGQFSPLQVQETLQSSDREVEVRRETPTIRFADVRYQVPVSRLAPGEYVVIFDVAHGKAVDTRHASFHVKPAR